SNALDVLGAAATRGEFYYHVQQSSFGAYVDQIGLYPAGGQAGWVFKVNGVSPPVGADQVQLADGDVVLWYWAEFGPAGGPPPPRAAPGAAGGAGRVARACGSRATAARPSSTQAGFRPASARSRPSTGWRR